MALYQSGVFWWVVGFLVGQIYYVAEARFYELKRYQAFLYGIVNLVMLCIGAKLLYIIENFSFVLKEGIRFSGFSLFGAIFIQLLSAKLISLIFKKDMWRVGSAIIIPFILMLGFYRIDCYRSGCCGGITIGNLTVPTQIIESVFCFSLAVAFTVITYKKHLVNGECFLWFYLIYGAMRFILEFFRTRTNVIGVFSPAHIWAALSIVLGIALLLTKKRKQHDTP